MVQFVYEGSGALLGLAAGPSAVFVLLLLGASAVFVLLLFGASAVFVLLLDSSASARCRELLLAVASFCCIRERVLYS